MKMLPALAGALALLCAPTQAVAQSYHPPAQPSGQKRLVPASLPPHYQAWLCIHRYEGSWTDTGDPYWGGLQMDWDFMRAYGADLLARKGPASNWTPLEQMWVAERAYRSGRGYGPWPQTARMCGLT